jgi:predicted secreted protein
VNELFKDKRSGRIAVVAHCILNQNSRVLGVAERSSMITEIVEFLMRNDVGIVQMSCPELTYGGVSRKPQTKHQYDTPTFRSHCKKIAKEIVDQIQDYAKCGINTEIVIGVDGSPSCGVSETSKESSYENTSKYGKVKGSGILIEQLCLALKERKISIPFYGIKHERLPQDLAKIEKILKD